MNKKTLFLVITLVAMLILVTSVNAATDNTNTSTTHSISEKTTTTEPVVKEVQKQEKNPEKQATKNKDKIIKENKTEKQTKTTTRTIEVYDFDSLNNAMTSAIADTENDEYIINLKENSVFYFEKSPKWYFNIDSHVKNVIINGNNQQLKPKTSQSVLFNNTNVHFKDTIITTKLINYGGRMTLENSVLNLPVTASNQQTIKNYDEMIFKNSTINTTLQNLETGTINISDDTIIGSEFKLTNAGTIIIDDLTRVMPIETIENTDINYDITNNGILNIKNSILNSTITNNGQLNISDDCIFGENLIIKGEGQIIYNNFTKIAPYLTIIKGNHTFEKITLQNRVILNGNIELINCELNNILIQNWGILTLNNCTIRQTEDIPWLSTSSNTVTVINDNTTIISGIITGSGEIFYGDAPEGYFDQPTEYHGENTLENMILIRPFTNNGLLTLTNCQINAKITNNGNLTLQNCSLSNNNLTTSSSKTNGFLVENNGNMIMIDCVVENNTFNTTKTPSYLTPTNVDLLGAIVNKGLMNVGNCTFFNNSVGFAIITDKEASYNYDYGDSVGEGSCIYNYGGNLTINSSTFKDNYAGKDGGAIISKNMIVRTMGMDGYVYTVTEANTLINNTKFINNTATGSGGAISLRGMKNVIDNSEFTENKILISINTQTHYGGAIELQHESYSPNPYLILNNTLFNNNYITAQAQSWSGNVGTIIAAEEHTNITINNCTFKNKNIETISTKASNITSNTFYSTTLKCDNSLGGDIYVKNNTFTNDSSLNINTREIGDSTIDKINILENTFINNTETGNTITFTGKEKFILESIKKDNKYLNTSLNDTLNLNLPDKIYTNEPITITGTYTINNPEYYDENILEQTKYDVYINRNYYQTVDTLDFTITPTTNNLMITVQPTISSTQKTVAMKTTTLTDIIITPENYNEYIYQGTLYYVNKDTKVLFNGTFTDKGTITIETNDIILDGTNATFTNTCFTLEASGITLQNMNINNTQTEYPIQNTANNNIITNNTITLTNTEGKTAAIYNKASNTKITYNTLTVDGPALTINHEITSAANTQAILLLGGDKNKIEYNTIKVTSTNPSEGFGTIEAITNYDQATNTNIANNNITVTGTANFKYAINTLKNVQNVTIQDNNIQVTGERYTDGIQVGNGADNILIKGNNIKCICQNTTPVDEEAITYGITTVTVGGIVSNNITIQDNNIDLTGTANYAIELYTTNNTLVENNTINVNGPESMGIGLAHSPNSTITGNNIKTSGDSTIPLGTVTEEIQPANIGIQIQQDSNNILIEDNTIQTYDKQGQDTCINITTNNVTVKNNNLTSSNKVGDNTITTTQPDTTTIEDNNAIEQNSTTQTATEDLTIGESTALTAQFYDDTYTPAGDGKAIFKVNGKTLRDNQGNVIYADVINGRAELPNINITQEWTKEDTTIQAVYVGDDNNEPITTTPTTVTVTKPEATITLDAPTEATAGTTITLKATVTDGENNITRGRVAFKLNGKTLKNAEGKALYANVQNGIATITYTIPAKTKAKEYTLTAVYTDTNYDRVEAESKLNVVKA